MAIIQQGERGHMSDRSHLVRSVTAFLFFFFQVNGAVDEERQMFAMTFA